MRPPTRPKDLGASGKALWTSVVSVFTLENWELHVLAESCRMADRAAEARLAIAELGVLIDSGRSGVKSNPACQVERDALRTGATLLQQLGVKSAQARDSAGHYSGAA